MFITHDLRIVRHLVDRIAVMYVGRIVETGDIRSVYGHPRHPYTRALLASVPTLDPTVRNIAPPIRDEIDFGKVTQGCPFRPRCPFAIAKCTSEAPKLRQVDGQHVACHRAEEFPRSVMPRKEVAQ